MGIVPSRRCPLCGLNRHVTCFSSRRAFCRDCLGKFVDGARGGIALEESELRPDLLRAFLETRYEVILPGNSITARIGHRSPDIVRLLGALGVNHAAILTAANPFSKSLSDELNAERNMSLAAKALELRSVVIPAIGSAEDGSWKEPSLFLAGLSQEQACNLSDHFEQNALVWAGCEEPTRLILRR